MELNPIEILRKHFELSKIKYPNESWKKFEECEIEQEFIVKAMEEYAASLQSENERLKDELKMCKGNVDIDKLREKLQVVLKAETPESVKKWMEENGVTNIKEIKPIELKNPTNP